MIPGSSPDHLDDVPSGAAEKRLEFLNDLAVAANRSIEALQIAVDDEDEVVEFLPRCQRQRTDGVDLVGLAVTEEGVHLLLRRVGQPTVLQVLVEPCLVDGVEGP